MGTRDEANDREKDRIREQHVGEEAVTTKGKIREREKERRRKKRHEAYNRRKECCALS